MIRQIKKILGWLKRQKKTLYLNKFRKKFASCGSDLLIYGKPRISFPKSIDLGNGVTLNDGCVLNATSSHIKIGNNVTLSADAKLLAATYEVEDFMIYHKRRHIDKSITIGDNVWICAGAIICPGVNIMPGG